MICQSCGMPLAQTQDFGSNIDGSSNSDYCHYCFIDGHFTDEGITLAEKMQKNIDIAVRMGMNRALASKLALKVLPGLQRWR